MENREEQIFVIIIDDKPRRGEGVVCVADDVYLTGGSVTFGKQECFLPFPVIKHVDHHDGVSVGLSGGSGINKHVAGGDVFDVTRFHLARQGVGACHPIEIAQIVLERIPRGAAAILERVAVHVLKVDATVLPGGVELLGAETHAHIGTLFVMAQQRHVNYAGRQELVSCQLRTVVEPYQCAAFAQRQVADKGCITASVGLYACIARWSGYVADGVYVMPVTAYKDVARVCRDKQQHNGCGDDYFSC